MLSYVWSVQKYKKWKTWSCKKNKKKYGGIMLLSKYVVCNSKKSKILTEREARGLLSSLGIRTTFSQIPLSGPLLFQNYKINEIINKFLLAGDKFMSRMHLRHPGFTNSTCGQFTKNKEEIRKFKESEDSRYIY